MIFCPEPMFSGAAEGLRAAVTRVIPAVFPLSVLFGALRLSGISSPYIAGILGGYPVGAQCVGEALSCGEIDRERAGYLVCFCNNPGPAFVICAVGQGVFGSTEAGILLELSVLFSSGLAALLLCPKRKQAHIGAAPLPLMKAFTRAAASSALGMLNLTGYIVLFRVINTYLGLPAIPAAALELSSGIFGVKSLAAAAFLLNFGGLCVAAQAMSFFEKPVFFGRYIISKLAAGALAAMFVKICAGIWHFGSI